MYFGPAVTRLSSIVAEFRLDASKFNIFLVFLESVWAQFLVWKVL